MVCAVEETTVVIKSASFVVSALENIMAVDENSSVALELITEVANSNLVLVDESDISIVDEISGIVDVTVAIML